MVMTVLSRLKVTILILSVGVVVAVCTPFVFAAFDHRVSMGLIVQGIVLAGVCLSAAFRLGELVNRIAVLEHKLAPDDRR